MRFLLTFLIWITFVGGLWMYTWQRDTELPKRVSVPEPVNMIAGNYTFEITPTFSIEPDPFALQSDITRPESIFLRINGQRLEAPDGEIRRGRVVKITRIPELFAGWNELVVDAGPPVSEYDLDHGVRVRVLEKEDILVDNTLWAGSGARVSGTIRFKIPVKKDQDHEK